MAERSIDEVLAYDTAHPTGDPTLDAMLGYTPQAAAPTAPSIEKYLPQRPAARGGNEQNLAYAYNYFLDQGLQPHQAAAIVGNLAQESGGHTGAAGGKILPGEAFSFGLAQHNKERLHGGKGYTGLIPFAKAKGTDPSDLHTQLDYIMHELKGPENKALQNLLRSRNLEEATVAFGEGYERPNARYANYANRLAQAQKYMGAAPPKNYLQMMETGGYDRMINPPTEGPAEDSEAIPLSNGQTLHAPKGTPRDAIIAQLQASGINAEPLKNIALANGQTLHIPESQSPEEALATLQQQYPDQNWMTKEQAEIEAKHGFVPAAKGAAYGAVGQMATGLGETAKALGAEDIGGYISGKGTELTKAGEEAFIPTTEEEAAKGVSPWLTRNITERAGQIVGGVAPYLPAAVAGGAAVPLLGTGAYMQEMGALKGEAEREGKPFQYGEALPYAAGAAAINTVGTGVLSPFAGAFKGRLAQELFSRDAQQMITKIAETEGFDAAKAAVGSRIGNIAKEVGINTGGLAFGDLSSEILHRAYTGKDLTSDEALDQYWENFKTDMVGGAMFGAPHGVMRHRAAEGAIEDVAAGMRGAAPYPRPEGEAGAPGEPVPPRGPEGGAPAGEIAPEDAAREQMLAEERAAEVEAAQAEVPEPVVRGEEQAAPPVEGAPIEEAPVEEAAPLSFADLGLKGKNSKVLMRALSELDLENPEHGKVIGEILDNAENVQHNPEVMQAIRAKLQEVQDASTQQIPEPSDAGGGARPQGGEEIGYPPEGGEGIRPSDQEGQRLAGEGKAPEEIKAPEVKYAKAEEPDKAYHAGDLGYGHDTTLGRMSGGRGTGHFGTGVYFVGDKSRIGSRADRPVHEVDFSDYNLAKPGNEADAQDLHNGLRDINRLVEHVKDGVLQPSDKVNDLLRSASYNLKYSVYPKREGRHVTQDEIKDSIIKNVQERAPVSDKVFATSAYEDTAATRVMKDLGYEGVDVRHIPRFDSGDYGSVIYKENLAPEPLKAEGIAPEAAHTVETLNDHIKQTYGKEAPRVDVLTREQAGVEPNVKGFYDPAKKRVVLVADNIGKGEDVHGLMRHEVAVHARRLGKTDPEFQAILDRLQRLRDEGDASVARAYDRVPKDTIPENIHEEALAYLSQHAPNLPIVKRFTSWMRRMAHKLTGSANWLKADDFGPMADAILKKRETEPRAEGAARLYSQGEEELPSYMRDVLDSGVGVRYTEGGPKFSPGRIREEAQSYIERPNDRVNWLERAYIKYFGQPVISKAYELNRILSKDDMVDPTGELYAKAKVAQNTQRAQAITNAQETGYLFKNTAGMLETMADPRLAPKNILASIEALPPALRDAFTNAMIIMSQAGHKLRHAENGELIEHLRDDLRLFRARMRREEPNSDAYRDASRFADETSARLTELVRRYNAIEREGGMYPNLSEAQIEAARRTLEDPRLNPIERNIRELFQKNAQLLYDTHQISADQLRKYTDPKYAYAPLYMSAEELEATLPGVQAIGGGQKAVPTLKRKGVSAHQVNFLENLMTHQIKVAAAAFENNARYAAVHSPIMQNLGVATRVRDPNWTPGKNDMAIAVMENGKRRYYKIDDKAVYDAFEAMHNLPLPEFFTNATKAFSKLTLANPMYWYRQLVREGIMATFTSRVGWITPYHTTKEFASLLFGGPNSEARRLYNQMRAQGLTGSHEYLKNLQVNYGSGSLSKSQIRKSADAWMQIHEFADAATKVAVMRKALKMAKDGTLTGSRLEGDAARSAAIDHVRQMLNLADMGNSRTARYLSQTTPFFNSWAQGLDALVRNATGLQMSPNEAKQARKMFLRHAATLAAFTAAYSYVMANNSQAYREAKPEDWENWLLPMPDFMGAKELRMFKGASPFEIGTLIKLPVEMMVRRAMGLDQGKDYSKVYKDALWRSVAPPGSESMFIPFIAKPALETAMGQTISLRESRPLMKEGIAPELQGLGESPLTDVFAQLGMSPAAAKHFMQGYLTEGFNMADTIAKGVASTFGTKTGRDDMRDITERWLFAKAFMTNPDKLDQATTYDIINHWKEQHGSALYAAKRGLPGVVEYAKAGAMSKAGSKIEEALSKINTALELLKNTPEYKMNPEDMEKRQKQLLESKKQLLKTAERLGQKQ